jgi:hypothetical protein
MTSVLSDFIRLGLFSGSTCKIISFRLFSTRPLFRCYNLSLCRNAIVLEGRGRFEWPLFLECILCYHCYIKLNIEIYVILWQSTNFSEVSWCLMEAAGTSETLVFYRKTTASQTRYLGLHHWIKSIVEILQIAPPPPPGTQFGTTYFSVVLIFPAELNILPTWNLSSLPEAKCWNRTCQSSDRTWIRNGL